MNFFETPNEIIPYTVILRIGKHSDKLYVQIANDTTIYLSFSSHLELTKNLDNYKQWLSKSNNII